LNEPFCASAVWPFDVGRRVSVTLPPVFRVMRRVWTSGFAVAAFAYPVPTVGTGCTALTVPGPGIATTRCQAFAAGL
jgi:hypothetical protein